MSEQEIRELAEMLDKTGRGTDLLGEAGVLTDGVLESLWRVLEEVEEEVLSLLQPLPWWNDNDEGLWDEESRLLFALADCLASR